MKNPIYLKTSYFAFRKDYVALDLETTGYDPRLDEIIEIGAIKVRNGQPIDRYGQLINPGRHIPNIVTEIHGIDDGMVKKRANARRRALRIP